jgi:hypothetical protein
VLSLWVFYAYTENSWMTACNGSATQSVRLRRSPLAESAGPSSGAQVRLNPPTILPEAKPRFRSREERLADHIHYCWVLGCILRLGHPDASSQHPPPWTARTTSYSSETGTPWEGLPNSQQSTRQPGQDCQPKPIEQQSSIDKAHGQRGAQLSDGPAWKGALIDCVS